jgi:hypothetical protein
MFTNEQASDLDFFGYFEDREAFVLMARIYHKL